jgi:pimeloyl-ACP methyl ester carboxylesterase
LVALGSRYCTSCGRPLAPAPAPQSSRPRRAPLRDRPGLIAGAILGAAGLAVVVGVAILFGSVRPSPDGSADGSPPAARPSAEDVDNVSCGVPDLACEQMTVRIDHNRSDDETLGVVFGVHAAEREHEGTLFILTGGPGSSGLDASPYYLSTLPPEVLDRFDVVFVDQRGVGRSAPLECPVAAQEYTVTPASGDPTDADDAWTARWVNRCLEEADVSADELDTYVTARVADDLDAYRRHLGIDRIHLYGESYGTALVQQYAASYPDHVAAAILDGPVDTLLDGPTFAFEQLSAFNAVTDATFAACEKDGACRADFANGDPAAAWTSLLEQVADGPAALDYPLLAGGTEVRRLTMQDLLDLGLTMTYTELDRVSLLRALAAASRNDLVPVLELAYRVGLVDPETLEPEAVSDDSLAVFLAVHCANYADAPTMDAIRDELSEFQEELAADGNAYASTIWDELPCLNGFVEAGQAVQRPGAPRGDFPTLVLTATADPATPTEWAERIAEQASDGYLVRTEGGAHVTFGLGLPCPDAMVVDLLVRGDVPDDPVTECAGTVLAPYVSLPRDTLGAYEDIAEALVAVEENVFASPAFLAWNGFPLETACRHGGSMTLRIAVNEEIALDGCELIDGWALSGLVAFEEDGTTTMELRASNAELSYESSPFWRVTVTGTLDGEPVEIERQFNP